MKRNILGAIWVMGVLSFAGFCLSICTPELDVQQAYNFSLQTLPVQKDIVKGAVAEIRCSLKAEGDFRDTRYTVRYFQPYGKEELRLEDGTLLSPNDCYLLMQKEFRLYYTSHSTDRQTIDVCVEDNFGQKKELHFSFNGKSAVIRMWVMGINSKRGEHFSLNMPEWQVDSLLRADFMA